MATLKATPDLWFVKVQQRSVKGIPDIIGCYKGFFFAWELKVGSNRVAKKSLQAYTLRCIEEAGGIAREVTPDNFDAVYKELICFPKLKDSFSKTLQKLYS
jgi:hypothetical protein